MNLSNFRKKFKITRVDDLGGCIGLGFKGQFLFEKVLRILKDFAKF